MADERLEQVLSRIETTQDRLDAAIKGITSSLRAIERNLDHLNHIATSLVIRAAKLDTIMRQLQHTYQKWAEAEQTQHVS
jgi:exonuclease VII small subunit